MNDGNLLRADRATELDRLTDAERRVLRLLAEGHTAKSIATTLDTTPAAVNERLREARRKTGVGSSRELARLLRAQEARDEQIGVAAPPASAAASGPGSAASRPWRKRGVAMLGVAIAAVAAATLVNQSPPTGDVQESPHSSQAVDPLLGHPMPSGISPDQLYARVRSEARDAVWAARAEQAVRARYGRIDHLDRLRVICGSSVCEVAGKIDLPVPTGDDEDAPEYRAINKVTKELQSNALYEDMKKAGLKFEAGLFAGSADKPPRSVFFTYYTRQKS